MKKKSMASTLGNIGGSTLAGMAKGDYNPEETLAQQEKQYQQYLEEQAAKNGQGSAAATTLDKRNRWNAPETAPTNGYGDYLQKGVTKGYGAHYDWLKECQKAADGSMCTTFKDMSGNAKIGSPSEGTIVTNMDTMSGNIQFMLI